MRTHNFNLSPPLNGPWYMVTCFCDLQMLRRAPWSNDRHCWLWPRTGPCQISNWAHLALDPWLWLLLSPRLWFLLTTWLWLPSPLCNIPSPSLPTLPTPLGRGPPRTVERRLRRGDVKNRSMGTAKDDATFSRHNSLSILPHGLIKLTPCFLVLFMNSYV